MKNSSLKLMTLLLCLIFSALIFPKDTLALSTPSAPTDLTASAKSSSEIFLDWDSESGATSYYVYRSKTSSGTYTKIATTTSSQYTDSDLSEDTTYYYKVVSVNSASSTSSYSTKTYATTDDSDDDSDLSAPKDLKATAVGSDEIELDWDSVSGAKSYEVYRSATSSGTYTKIGTTKSSSYTDDDDLEEDTTYYYKVRAVDGSDKSSYSSKEHATTDDDDSDDSDLSAPKDLTATAVGSDEIELDWDSVSGAESYEVYRSTTSSGTYTKIGTTKSSNYTDDDDLEEDTTYYYKVRAVDGSDKSSYSSKEHATTGDDDSDDSDLSAPKDLKATAEGSDEIELDWDSVSGAKSYEVYRSTTSSGTYTKIGTSKSSNYTDDDDLEEDTTYYYKVRAVDGSDKSDYSSKEHATTDESDDSDISAPTNLKATVESSSAIYLDWDSVSDATSYYVYTSASSSGTYSKLATTTTSSYRDTNLSRKTTYYYKVVAVNSSDTSGYSSKAYATTASSDDDVPTNPSTQIQSDRLAGEDMYGTSAEVAKAGWNTSYYAIVVSGDSFSDALCSAPLAKKYNAPLLLTTKDSLNEQTRTQLARLEVKKVIMVGGTGIISSGVEQSIKTMGIGVLRIVGTDRYDTSIKIAQAMGEFDQAVIASGETFPDALSIAPIAAMKGMPILLTPKDKLPASIEAYLLKNAQSTYVVGGTGVISDNVLKQLPSPKRLSGITRYDTNISIIKEFEDELDFSTCYVSTGEKFADALSGSALASLFHSPLILVSDPVEQTTIDYISTKIGSIKKEVVFGGIAIVPNSILINIEQNTDVYDTPSAPKELTATTESSSQINLKWDSVSGATSYQVYGAISATGTYTHIATVTATSYINFGLWADTTYYYKVKAVNNAGSSPFSPVDHAKTSLSDD
ncbi:cell wall-binding repeat-containing protein [Desulfosporosinus nitroreducens]|uniref:Cell wall-binding repeat-containing protein n=1 Tax=Desulfosporosinus nitroreducens TaxID=2018668 RepID=A0ABT8QSX1_9FIRM|nr:cell wall-binding repeat-containing protein [Desulfosporosinus nitroreducens]MDO0824458.1 cell wall-binding repeat-containing protein [Desulfosporosinus nitroreducens]